MKKRPITAKQRAVLEFCAAFFARNDQLPPIHIICSRFGWSSWNAGQEHMEALARRGLIEKNTVGKWKFTEAGRLNTTVAA
jgi:SOS-response transcriptional repressor LexA